MKEADWMCNLAPGRKTEEPYMKSKPWKPRTKSRKTLLFNELANNEHFEHWHFESTAALSSKPTKEATNVYLQISNQLKMISPTFDP